MATQTVRVKGLRDFMRATTKAERETKKAVRDKLKEAGDIIRQDASERFSSISVKSAAGLRTRARMGSVFVEQSLRKTTGLRPDFARLQMRRGLEPALEAKSDEVERRLEKAMDELADIVEGRRF
jgi:hypothetical protein